MGPSPLPLPSHKPRPTERSQARAEQDTILQNDTADTQTQGHPQLCSLPPLPSGSPPYGVPANPTPRYPPLPYLTLQEIMRDYIQKHPELNISEEGITKSTLTKAERQLKDKFDGRPTKPPP